MVHVHVGEDIGDGERVGDVRLAGAALLAIVGLLCVPITALWWFATGPVFELMDIEAETTEALDDTLDRIGEAKGVKGLESLIHLSTKLDRGA